MDVCSVRLQFSQNNLRSILFHRKLEAFIMYLPFLYSNVLLAFSHILSFRLSYCLDKSVVCKDFWGKSNYELQQRHLHRPKDRQLTVQVIHLLWNTAHTHKHTNYILTSNCFMWYIFRPWRCTNTQSFTLAAPRKIEHTRNITNIFRQMCINRVDRTNALKIHLRFRKPPVVCILVGQKNGRAISSDANMLFEKWKTVMLIVLREANRNREK